MLRSPFRGKQTADITGTKDGKDNKRTHGKSHFSYHRENNACHYVDSHDDIKRANIQDNLNNISTETGSHYDGKSEASHSDWTQEFSEQGTRSGRSDKESANLNEDEEIPENKAVLASSSNDEKMKDQGRESFPNSEKQIYEMQLAQLQEQLVNTMIDYQDVCAQLKKLKATDVNKLQKELREEKEKNTELKEKLKQRQKAQNSKLQRKNASRIHGVGVDSRSGKPADDWVDLGMEEEVTLSRNTSDSIAAGSSSQIHEECTQDELDGAHHRHTHGNSVGQSEHHSNLSSVKAEEPPRVQRVKAKLEMWKTQIVDLIVDRLWDFVNDEPETSDEEDDEGEPLTVKKLKENITRFSDGIKPITSFVKSVHGVFSWSNPTASFLIFLVYMYSVWHGFLLSMILFIVIWKLFTNYLHAKGIAKKLGFVEVDKNETNSSDDHSWSDKFQLVLQVARKVQNTLGKMADSLEKLKNLLMWQHPAASRKLFTSLFMALTASLLLKGKTLFLVTGLFLGIKLFIVNPIQHRFPKVKRRYDTTEKLWRELPTDADLAARKSETQTSQEVIPRASSTGSLSSPGNGNSSEQSRNPSTNPILDKFKLPATETFLPEWEYGKRCILLDKEKTFTNVKHGKLFLTQSYLCFEKGKTSFGKHIVIQLESITSLTKAKPIPIMPGTGMALEVHVHGIDKPYIFGGIIGRDEAFESIRATGRAANYPWALT
ncbi:GRAM domain-containing protein 4-like [Montipora capricornis]|uniref:GRAM domain-containing protein 4-like n=1 Tax=Montipora capricornis TaxID=246305 RepID=UPI0035F1BF31